MIKYRTKLIERLTHGKSVSHLIKTITGRSKPPEVVTCFGSFKANMGAPGDFWEKQFFTYSRNGGPIQRITIDYSTAEGEEDYIAIDALCGKVDKDLTRGQDGESLAFYINAGIRGLTAIGEQAIPVVNGTIYYGPDSPQMMSMSGPDQFEYAITGINGEGKVVLPSAYVVDARDIAVPHPFESIDPFNMIDYPRWYPENSIQTEDNTITIYPSEGASEDDFDLFKVMGGVGDTPITVHSCVVAVPPKVQCLPSFVYTADTDMPAMMSLDTEASPQSLNVLEGNPNTVNGMPFPFNMDGRSNSGYTPTNWPDSDGNTWGWDWVCTYSKNDGPIKTIGWNTASTEGQHHSVWEAIKALMLDDEGRTAFTLTGFNAISPRWDRPSLKSGLSSGAMFGDFESDVDMDMQVNYEYCEDAASVEIKDRQMQFTQTQAGLAWKENKLVIYPTTFEDAKAIGIYEYDDYYNFLCQYQEQFDAGEPITLHSCAVVEPIDHVRVNTGFEIDVSSLGEVVPPGLIVRVQINDGVIKEFAEEGELIEKVLVDVLNYVTLLGADPIITSQSDMGVDQTPRSNAQSKTNLLYFKSIVSDIGEPSIVGCSGIEQPGDFNMELITIDVEAQTQKLLQVEILDDMDSDIPHVRASNKVTFHRAVGSEYVDFFDFIVGAKGDTHTIYSSAGIPCLLHGESVEGGGDNGSIDDLEDEYMQWREPWVFSITKTNGMGESFNPTISAVYGTDFVIVDHDTGERLASTFGRTHEGIIERIPENKNLNIIFNMDALGGSRTFELHFGITGGSVVFGNDIDVGGRKEGELEIIQWNSDCAPKIRISAANMTVTLPDTLPVGWNNLSSMFKYTNMANPDISMWDVSNVVDMEYMFHMASGFNQDLSSWCVERISSEPYYFRNSATKWTLPKPVWGTCPVADPIVVGDYTEFTHVRNDSSYGNADKSLTLVLRGEDSTDWVIQRDDVVVFDETVRDVSNTNVIYITPTYASISLKFPEAGSYNFKVFGEINEFSIEVDSQGSSDAISATTTLNRYSTKVAKYKFDYRKNNIVVPDELPSHLTDLSYMFNNCVNFNQDVSGWDVSNVTNMGSMFSGCNLFNADISGWNMSNVTNIDDMLKNCRNFNQPIQHWDISNITSLRGLLNTCVSFNQDISGWDVSHITDMNSMLADTRALTADISGWNTSNVTNMGGLFAGLNSLPYNIENWNTSSVVNMSGMFSTCREFNQDISNWDTSKVETMANMFYRATEFNQLIGKWNTSNVTDMSGMFYDGYGVSSSIKDWDVSNVTTMREMFYQTRVNADISGWDVSKVTDMYGLFSRCEYFNRDISGWDVSNVTNMESMFWQASRFNQDLSKWCVTNISTEPSSFSDFAYAWTLPKPVWGTCPVAYPPGVPLEFNLTTPVDLTQTEPLTFELEDWGTGWALYEDDVLISNSETMGPGVSHSMGGFNRQIIKIDQSNFANRTVNYKMFVSNKHLNVSREFDESSSLYPSVEVLSFSDTSSRQSLRFAWTDMTVPTVLPRNITSTITMFDGCQRFNQDISMWDTSNVTDMSVMFRNCISFNQPIGVWDVSNVTDMSEMFAGCSSFNQDISGWNVSLVKIIRGMFDGATVFNSDISGWNLDALTDCHVAFKNATTFNQDISGWDTSNVTGMSQMFSGAHSFNQDISKWDVRQVRDMREMFYEAASFNQDLSKWCVTNIPSKPNLFSDGAVAWTKSKPIWGTCPRGEDGSSPVIELDPNDFNVNVTLTNKDPSSRDTHISLKMRDMTTPWTALVNGVTVATSDDYSDALSINLQHKDTIFTLKGDMRRLEYTMDNFEEIGVNVEVLNFSNTIKGYGFSIRGSTLALPETLPSCVTDMSHMLSSVKLTTPVVNWDTSQVTDMSYLFFGSSDFNGDISGWNTSNVTNMEGMFYYAEAFNQDLSMWDVGLISNEPTDFATGATVWTLPRPVWGTAGAPKPLTYLPLDPTGASGFYITLSRNGSDFRTFNLTDPSFTMDEFLKYAIISDDDTGFAFVGYPAILASEDLLPEDATNGLALAGFIEGDRVATPRHPDGYPVRNYIVLSEDYQPGDREIASPPLTYVPYVNKIIVKATPDIPQEYDMFYSLPGAVEGGTVTTVSNTVVPFD